MISILDYGRGNLRSVQKALEFLGLPAFISSDGEEILNSRALIVPGVGAFPDAMDNMREKGLDEVVKQMAALGKPILGICLGMQLFFEEGYEVTECRGLGFFKGKVRKIEGKVKVPHIGWNSLNFETPSPLLQGIEEGGYVYFVHSYYADIEEPGILNAYSMYEKKIPAIVSKDNIYGIQFHPEKSGEQGLRILKNWGELIK